MGLISDYFEDAAERYGQYLWDLGTSLETLTSPNLHASVVLYPCTVCRKPFPSHEDLNAHIRSSHALEHVYLLADGKVIRDVAFLPNGLKSIKPILLGVPSGKITIRAPGRSETYDLLEFTQFSFEVPQDFEGEFVVIVEPSQRPARWFTFYVRKLPNFRAETLDTAISRIQENYEKHHDRPELSRWKRAVGGLPGTLEERYVNGFFEFTLGTYLESVGKIGDAKVRLEESFGLLLPFRTGLALTALRVLGFKMNCFSLLSNVPVTSPFAPADAFFNSGKTEFNLGVFRNGDDCKVVTDVFTDLCLQALLAYFHGNEADFYRLRGRMESHPLKQNRNNEDKLRLMAARFELRRRNDAGAREEYEELVDHPDFGQEARRILDERRT